jgi:hypothetical protein
MCVHRETSITQGWVLVRFADRLRGGQLGHAGLPVTSNVVAAVKQDGMVRMWLWIRLAVDTATTGCWAC